VAGRRYRWLNSTSMSTLIADLPYGLYRILAILSFLVGPIALGAALFRGIRLREHSGDDFGGAMLMAGLGGLLGFYGLFSSVYGDGYGDMPRHAIGLLLGIDLQVGAWLLVVLNLLSRARARERHRQMLSLSYASGTERIRY
jgi:hypothetical protein